MIEDPGVGTLSAVIEAMRQLFNFVGHREEHREHGRRHRTHVPLHELAQEQHGRQGQALQAEPEEAPPPGGPGRHHQDRRDWGGFRGHARPGGRAKEYQVDFVITQTSTGEWLLHNKESNEQNVIRAQRYALNSRYGAREQSEPWQGPERIDDTCRSDPLRQDSAWVDVRQEQAAREQQEQATQQQ